MTAIERWTLTIDANGRVRGFGDATASPALADLSNLRVVEAVPADAYEGAVAAIETQRARVESLRIGSGGTDDPNTGGEWFRAQIVALDLALVALRGQ